jgi:FkbM family methyltransferase
MIALNPMATNPIRDISLPGLPPYKLMVHAEPDIYLSREILQHGVWEPFETQVICSLLEPGNIFVDLGANIGWYSVMAGVLVGSRGRVYSFEPDPKCFSLLTRNASLNGLENLTAEKLAVAHASGSTNLYLHGDNFSDHRLYDSGDGRDSVPVSAVSLDEYFSAATAPIDLLKIDIQGAEWHAFQGMRHILQRGLVERVIFEFWPVGLLRAGASADALVSFLAEQLGGYVAIIVEQQSRLFQSSYQALRELALGPIRPETEGWVNVLVTRQPLATYPRFRAPPWVPVQG